MAAAGKGERYCALAARRLPQKTLKADDESRRCVARPNWEYIRVDVLLMEHPKIEGLSDKAFRALIDLWCYCGRQRTDGIVTEKRWRNVRVPARKELVDNGLAEPMPIGGVVMHDYTEYQRSRTEIDELAAARAEKARKAANARWGNVKEEQP